MTPGKKHTSSSHERPEQLEQQNRSPAGVVVPAADLSASPSPPLTANTNGVQSDKAKKLESTSPKDKIVISYFKIVKISLFSKFGF